VDKTSMKNKKGQLLHFYSVRYIYLQSFLLIPCVVSQLCPGQCSKCKNEQKAIIKIFSKEELQFLCNALLLNEIYLLTQLLLIPYVVSGLCPGQSSTCKSEQMATPPKLGKAELLFICTTLLLNKIYQPTKCLVDTSCSFIRMSRTRCGRTDVRTYGRTDKAVTICSPFVEHKTIPF